MRYLIVKSLHFPGNGLQPPRRRQGAFSPALGLKSVGPSLVIDCIYVGFNAKAQNNNPRRYNTSRTFLSIQHTCNDRLLFSLCILAPKVLEEPSLRIRKHFCMASYFVHVYQPTRLSQIQCRRSYRFETFVNK